MKKNYDVVFNSNENSDSMGFHATKEYCIDYIKYNNGSNYLYFGDYKGGIVSVLCNQNDEYVYNEIVK